MAIVFNNARTTVFINEMKRVIPYDGKPYVLPDIIATRYKDRLSIIPQGYYDEVITRKQKEILEVERNLNKRIKEFIVDKRILEIEKNEIYKEREELLKEKLRIANAFLRKTKKKVLKDKNDFLYSYCFNNDSGAIKRLRHSINSIIKQNVNVCVCNTSKKCIYNEIKDLGNIKYVHRPINISPYSKTLTINAGVRLLVESDYFFISDIDLIYPPTFVKEILKYTTLPRPVRVVFYNYNFGHEFYSNNFKDYVKNFEESVDISRKRFGQAPGNGLIHLESFKKIRGFNEEFVGYGPEDAEFNFRIQYINEYFEIDSNKINTYHLYHDRTFHDINHRINYLKYKEVLTQIRDKISIDEFDEKIHLGIISSNNGKDWGIV